MFGLFSKKAPQPQIATITFDEAYCHSAGNGGALIYQLPKETTHLRVVVPDFEGFWQTYINRNEGLSNETLIALRDHQALFTLSVVQDGEYHYRDGMGDDGTVTLHAGNLHAMGAKSPFPGFSNGALAFGIYHPGTFRFEVLWATMYNV